MASYPVTLVGGPSNNLEQNTIKALLEQLNIKDGFHTTTTENNAIADGKSYVGGGFATTVASTVKSIYHFRTGNKIAQ